MNFASFVSPAFGVATMIVAATITPALAATASGTNVGSLDCMIDGGIGLIFGSKKEVSCTFHPVKGSAQNYRGSITKIGVDIGFTQKSYVKWLVFAPGSLEPGALAGSYGGASAEATVVVGLGANVLVGGLKNSIALQPVSVQGQTGLNLAVGIAGLKLKHDE